MGHMYPENISKYLLLKLFGGCFDDNGLKESPIKITIPEFANYFIDKISQMDTIIEKMENEEDIKLLTELKEENYGVTCAEGVYFDKGMIKWAISDCLYYSCKHGIVNKMDNIHGLEDDYYYFDLKEYRRLKDETGKEIEDYIIKYIVH